MQSPCSRPTPWGVLRVRCVDRPEPRIKSDREPEPVPEDDPRLHRAGISACALPLRGRAASTTTRRCSRTAGLKSAPRSIAKKLTQRDADGTISVLGFNPLMNWYENSPSPLGPARRSDLDEERKSNLAGDPGWATLLRWQKSLVDWYGQEPRQVAGKRRTSGQPRTRSRPAGLAMNFDVSTARRSSRPTLRDSSTEPLLTPSRSRACTAPVS